MATIIWVLLISTGTVVNHVALSNLATEAGGSAQSTQVAALEARLAELGQQLEAPRQQPDMLTTTQFETERQAIEQRVSRIEQALSERLTAESLTPLHIRIEQLEARLAKAAQVAPAPTRTRKNHASRPKAAVPPFKVVGLEMRGGERFLSIQPAGGASSPPTSVLRPGESEAGWRLESIEDRTAVFQNNGQVLRVVAP
ncbi:Methyl-accepting chemotaxis protein [plant metagenome]|uniref:Methyl-accepting chemotaxis protein n=1 Tax=plant metagenome TaxID=1297885 RepID=A0A484QC71_9ZZZZ